MTFEERCIAHYGPIHRRLAHPPKRPIVMPPPRAAKPEPREKVKWPKRKPDVRASIHDYDEESIKAMRLNGATMKAVADRFDIPIKAMESYICRNQARWRAE